MESIPKIIHYCWFGPNQKPKSVKKYIKGWKEKLPDYQFIEWNESNFDVSCCQYVEQAYHAKKFAFVSDYARLKALYDYGGIYLDTDVEVYKDFSLLLNRANLVFGFEEKEYVATSTMLSIKKSKFIKRFINSYHVRHFINVNGIIDTKTNVEVLTQMLVEQGVVCDGSMQSLLVDNESITILPQIYLSPYDYINCFDRSNELSFTKHNFDISWGNRREFVKKFIKTLITKCLGPNFLNGIRARCK
ncbi:TPA: glycosyltransferase family 32 protein [Photobacterium damselae]